MPSRTASVVSLVVLGICGAIGAAAAQAPASNQPARANMAQVMRSILFPNSNLIFATQTTEPAEVGKVFDVSPAYPGNSFSGKYMGWQVVENAALALVESADLLTSARPCENGRPAPVQAADWKMYVEGLRAAGRNAYAAARTKDQDKMLETSEVLAEACADCHRVYREVTPRCVKQ
jgi:cytochrome c556